MRNKLSGIKTRPRAEYLPEISIGDTEVHVQQPQQRRMRRSFRHTIEGRSYRVQITRTGLVTIGLIALWGEGVRTPKSWAFGALSTKQIHTYTYRRLIAITYLLKLDFYIQIYIYTLNKGFFLAVCDEYLCILRLFGLSRYLLFYCNHFLYLTSICQGGWRIITDLLYNF